MNRRLAGTNCFMTQAMTRTYTLHYAPDNASLIIRLALEEIGVPYDTVLVDRAAQAQTLPAYRALNPAIRPDSATSRRAWPNSVHRPAIRNPTGRKPHLNVPVCL